MATIIYKGFSTINQNKKFKLNDFDLAKQDLLNHLSIRRGEKLMNPEFGTIIWTMLFEPLNEQNRKIITDDLTIVARTDPRLSVDSIEVTEYYDHGLMVTLDLTYIPTNEKDHLYIPFVKAMEK